jgi:hypothetical protein
MKLVLAACWQMRLVVDIQPNLARLFQRWHFQVQLFAGIHVRVP